jgi:Uma2 family endonuclease
MMNLMGATTTLLTFEEFEQLPDAPGKRELLDGELIELPPPKHKHTITQHRIADDLRPYAARRGLLVLLEAGFLIGKGRNEWLQPDVSVVSREQEERAAADPEGYYEGAPLIAIEVISPSNTAEAIERKLAKYFENGAGEVWVVYPKTRRIWRYAGLQAQAVIEHDVFTSPLLPGFEMDLAGIFR